MSKPNQSVQVFIFQLYAEQEPVSFVRMSDSTNDDDLSLARAIITHGWNQSAEELNDRVIENTLDKTIENLTQEVTNFIQGDSIRSSYQWYINDDHDSKRYDGILTRLPVMN